jgi:CRISPR-associated protein Cas2
MFAIIVYDVSTERVTKVCHFLRKYMDWIQNSVFEGELTKSQLKEVESGLKNIINETEDHISIYTTHNKEAMIKKTLGTPKSSQETVI